MLHLDAISPKRSCMLKCFIQICCDFTTLPNLWPGPNQIEMYCSRVTQSKLFEVFLYCCALLHYNAGMTIPESWLLVWWGCGASQTRKQISERKRKDLFCKASTEGNWWQNKSENVLNVFLIVLQIWNRIESLFILIKESRS